MDQPSSNGVVGALGVVLFVVSSAAVMGDFVGSGGTADVQTANCTWDLCRMDLHFSSSSSSSSSKQSCEKKFVGL